VGTPRTGTNLRVDGNYRWSGRGIDYSPPGTPGRGHHQPRSGSLEANWAFEPVGGRDVAIEPAIVEITEVDLPFRSSRPISGILFAGVALCADSSPSRGPPFAQLLEWENLRNAWRAGT